MSDPIYLLAVLGAIAAIAEWLGRRPAGSWLGGAIITLILGILLANLGIIPTISNAPPLYGSLVSVGASCDFEARAGLGRTGELLVLFVALVLLVHGLVQFGVGRRCVSARRPWRSPLRRTSVAR